MSPINLRRQGMSLFYLIPVIFVGYPFFHEVLFQSDVFRNIFTLFLYGLFSVTLTIVMHTHLSYFVRVSETSINFNGVAQIPFDTIKGAYLGTISDLESIEKRDKLPLESFKDDYFTNLFRVEESKCGNYPKGVFLALHVGHTIYLIQASYFKRSEMERLIDRLEANAVPVERFELGRAPQTKVL